VEPGRRIAWRGATEPNRAVDDGPTTLVEWDVEPTAHGGTILHLRESGFENEQSLDDNTQGWLEELAELRELLAVEAWDHPIRRTLELDVDRERIWRAITDRDELLEWWGPLSTGLRVEPGSEGWFDFPEHGAHAVRFETVDSPRYLAWRWVPGDPDVPIDEADEATVVEWVLQSRPGGGTTLHLVESGFRGPQKFGDNSSGWDEILPGLLRVLEAG